MIVTTVEIAGEPLQRSGRDPYALRRQTNAELGFREHLRDIIVPGRYTGGTITAVGETVTVPAGSVFHLNVGVRSTARVELTDDVVQATNEGGGDDTLWIRASEVPTEEGPANVVVFIEAAPDGTPPGPNAEKLGNTAMGTFTPDATLDKVLAN